MDNKVKLVYLTILHLYPKFYGVYMSKITVNDEGRGVFRLQIVFTSVECERLPYNILRQAHVAFDPIPDGTLQVTADFNLRQSGESAVFIDWLLRFGSIESERHFGRPSLPAPSSDDDLIPDEDSFQRRP